MTSSTSSSDSALSASRAMALLLAALAAYLGVLEIGTRVAVSQVFEGQRSQREDRRAALALRPVRDGRRTVLVVGNSLLRASVNRAELAQALAPDHAVSVFPVDYSAYWDWYFGLCRLFDQGGRPSVVVLSLNPQQLLSDSTVGERFAHSMMQLRDIPRVARVARLDMTTASNYFFAHWSGWLGDRWHIRNWVLAQWVPDAAALMERFVPKQKEMPVTGAVVERAVLRLNAMRRLVEAHGSRFVFLIPPSIDAAEPASQIQQAAHRAGVLVLLPYRPGELPLTAFSDGFHLNTSGAVLYRERLWPALHRALSGPDSEQPAFLRTSH